MTTTNLPITSAQQIKLRIAELSVSLANQLPNFHQLLQIIHKDLQEHPGTVTLLSPEEFATITKSLEKQTQTEIVSSSSKTGKGVTKARAAKMSLEDLF